MPVASIKPTVLRYYELLNRGEYAALADCFAPDFVHHLPGVPAGFEAFKQLQIQYRHGFADLHSQVEAVIEADDHVVVRTTTRGTHTGVFFGHRPTRRTFAAAGIDIFRGSAAGLVEYWGVFDTISMLHQLGLYSPATEQ